ncbi:MAG: serine/threonine protein kinase [Acidobacteria bacterium]|nr:serine/threonine protein kinase [Acidobacteriota bacterium]
MALVFRGEDPLDPARGLAVKLLRPEVHGDAELVRRFLREGEVLSALRHPHLVEVYAFGKTGAWPYLVMELLPGGSLKACLGEAPARLVSRLLPVAGALDAAHAAGVVHRDLKPSNLLFAVDGRLKVTDFGVCLWEGGEGTRLTRSQMVVGTLGYMAPEQHGDPRRVDGRCDVYALGAILYEFTTGSPYAQVQLPPAAARPGFPPRLARILMEALAPDPARRTPDMASFQAALEDWMAGAEAAGWGAAPLPGHDGVGRDAPTLARPREADPPGGHLEAYLEALRTGAVGQRRAAAEGLMRHAVPRDESQLLEVLPGLPEGSRFALVRTLGKVGSAAALPALLALLEDPYAKSEAAEAASLVALRTGRAEDVLSSLREPGLGSPARWTPRARLGDSDWVLALAAGWDGLGTPQRLQALEAARALPPEGLALLKARLQGQAQGFSGALREMWLRL